MTRLAFLCLAVAACSASPHLELPPDAPGSFDASPDAPPDAGNGHALRIATGAGTPLTAWDFGSQEAGSASPALALTVTNDTAIVSDVLLVSLVGSAADQFTVDAASDCVADIELAPGASCGLRLRFAPGQIGAQAAALVIDAGTAVGRATLQASGTGVAGPDLDTVPASFDFGPSELGVVVQQTMRVDNVGEALVVQSVAVGNPIGSGFSVSSTTCGGALAAGASCDVVIAYTPTAFGQDSGTLAIETDHGPYAIGANWVMGAGAARLTVQVTGLGAVASDGGGVPDIDCGVTCSGLFLGPDHVLTASTDGAFTGWSVAGCGAATTCAVTLGTTPTVVQAAFTP